MTRIALKQVIGRSPETQALVQTLSDAFGTPCAVEDSDGRLLHGARLVDGERFVVSHGDASIGWVSGSPSAAAVARVLNHLVAKEAERKALGAEVLHLYRELNLIYSFSEKLAALLETERVATLTLHEARHLIVATDGVIMLLDDNGEMLATVAAFGDDPMMRHPLRRGDGLIGAVAMTGVGEIVNDADADPRLAGMSNSIKSLIAAPLRVGERVTGVIALGSTLPMQYTAAELKLLSTLALQTATAVENARLFERTVQAARERERLLALHQQAEIERAKLENELVLAASIQAALFPAALPDIPGYQLAASNRPARQCGGDYYDVIANGGGDDAPVLLCVADVSGKGLPASLVMSNMQATLRALLGRERSLPRLAARASELLFASTAPEKYVTAAFAELRPSTGSIRFLGAGHLDTLILKANGDAVTLSSTGLPLGLLPPAVPYTEIEHQLEAGDMLVLYSDGVTEAQNASSEEYGEARLLECLRATAAQPVARIIECVLASIDAFVRGSPQFDDITILMARRA